MAGFKIAVRFRLVIAAPSDWQPVVIVCWFRLTAFNSQGKKILGVVCGILLLTRPTTSPCYVRRFILLHTDTGLLKRWRGREDWRRQGKELRRQLLWIWQRIAWQSGSSHGRWIVLRWNAVLDSAHSTLVCFIDRGEYLVTYFLYLFLVYMFVFVLCLSLFCVYY